tara:strand:- start:75 stop:539 length:465 start_codon:yes stop_codon:yes gene_type:complete
MLAACTTKLLELGYHIHLVARSPDRYASRINESLRTRLSTSSCDYADDEAFAQALRAAPQLVVGVIGWIHSASPNAWNIVRKTFTGADMLRVLGSSHNPINTETDRVVTLGFVIEESGSRWLTHQEISEGVLDAFLSGRAASIVGTVEPRSMKP